MTSLTLPPASSLRSTICQLWVVSVILALQGGGRGQVNLFSAYRCLHASHARVRTHTHTHIHTHTHTHAWHGAKQTNRNIRLNIAADQFSIIIMKDIIMFSLGESSEQKPTEDRVADYQSASKFFKTFVGYIYRSKSLLVCYRGFVAKNFFIVSARFLRQNVPVNCTDETGGR